MDQTTSHVWIINVKNLKLKKKKIEKYFSINSQYVKKDINEYLIIEKKEK